MLQVTGDGAWLELAREGLVERLVTEGRLADPAVAAAFQAVPRHVFVPGVPAGEAYRDVAIPTKHDGVRAVSSSSQPAIMATMLEQLDVRPGQRVLEIGAGTGYNAALLARLVGERGAVVTVDIDPDLAAAARSHLRVAAVDDTVSVVCADGTQSLPDCHRRFDRIIVTAGAWDLAPAWIEQLAPHGRMVLPLSLGGAQRCLALEHVDGHLRSISVRDCGFMPLRGAFAGPDTLTDLAPGGGVFVHYDRALPADPQTVRGWLDEPQGDQTTGLEVPVEQVVTTFGLWLALAEPASARLAAFDSQPSELARALLPLPDFPATLAILDEQGLAVLTYPGPSPEPVARAFGPDGRRLAARLVEHVSAWHHAGRPTNAQVQVDIHAAETRLPTGTTTVDRPRSRIAVQWASRGG